MNKLSKFQITLQDMGIPYSASVIANPKGHDAIRCSGHFKIRTSGTDFIFDCFGEFLKHESNVISNDDIPSSKISSILGNKVDMWYEFTGDRSDDERGTEFLDDDELPMLVLATQTDFRFREPDKWRAISHQHGGMACEHTNMMIMKLNPTMAARNLIHEVDREMLGSESFLKDLDTLIRYRQMLTEFGVDCNSSYDYFSEALYPIDATSENIRLLTDDKLPTDLNELVNWEGENAISKVFGIIGRWKIFILGNNSD